ncbi:MAG TPA: dihydrofolate reductase family protein [Allosphingosinicella sp.]|nr:dihydrofolate reductase family protein [Allosphingosinicella sp.]
MRKLIAAAFVSLDGVMQAPGGPDEDPSGGFLHGGWSFGHWDAAMEARMGEAFARPFDLLLGRRTYEIFAAHWGHTQDEPGPLFTGITKYVATSADLGEPFAWANSMKLEGDVPAAVARLKEGDGPDLLTQGSSVLVRSLLAAGLVDELSLMTFPVILGKGKRWYGEDAAAGEWELVASETATTGVIMSRYRPKGPVSTGSFAFEQPNAAEVARRAKQAAEG